MLGASSVIYAASIVVTILHHPLLCFDTVGRMLIQRPGNMWFFLSVILSSTALSAARAEDAVTFNRDIRPILADKCFACHGPDAATREADLRLDQEESAKRDREGHAAIQAGDPKHSELAVRIRSTDPDLMMPPPDSQRTLTDEEKQTLLGWIADGAKWEGHWSFIAPRRSALPEVSDARWPRNAIDHFVLRKLDDAGLQPSSETERTTWIRRASFDLTGLPPTMEEVDAFLADDGDVAFEAVIDRLLRSKHYGEQMAAAWLDAARYADTDGYQNDGPRTMFRYRDWVIDAFNGNMPFDQFTIEQLAGDLLPQASLSQKIATGFNRNHRYNSEAGLVLEEFLLENAVDRVDTTSTVWMGLTIGCARCHDHKYDPIEQREYYQLISFFGNITESGRAIKFGNSEPWIVAPTDEQQKQLADLDNEIQSVREQLRTAADESQDVLKELLKREPKALASGVLLESDEEGRPAAGAVGSQGNLVETVIVANGLQHHFRFDDMEAEGITVEKGAPVFREGLHGNAATVGGNGILALGKVGDVACQTRSSISFWLKPEKLKSGVILSRQSGNDTRPGFSVELRDGHLQFYIITRWIAGVGAVETTTALKADEWIHVTLTNDGSQRTTGQHVWFNGELAETSVLHNTNSNTGGTKESAILRIGGGVYGDLFKGQVDDLRLYDRTLFDDEIDVLAEPKTVSEILSLDEAARTGRMRNKLIAWAMAMSGSQDLMGLRNEDVQMTAAIAETYLQLRLKRVKLVDSFPTSMVMEERPVPSQTPIRLRGIYNKYGDVVASGVPAVFPELPNSDLANRHDFAKWLVNGEHPLTARVIVNRFWQQYFGTGLVKTSEDFGMQGELPSHPQLLDWLAVEFVESGWDVKSLQKLIVLSATYRQSSRHAPRDEAKRDMTSNTTDPRRDKRSPQSGESTPANAESAVTATPNGLRSGNPASPCHAERDGYVVDPENRLLWRGPRIRLSARQLRDQALFVSGLLTPDIGGPSVSPYQPAKLWAEMSNMKYKQSKGKDLYRRGLYTIWKRTVAPPSLAILDAADRENCAVRQKRTNTPLQALTLLNETTFVESARHLAMRMISEGSDDPVRFAFRAVTAREPSDKERLALTNALNAYRQEFGADTAKAKDLLFVGESKLPKDVDEVELAAGTMLCNVLLNLDEVVTKE